MAGRQNGNGKSENRGSSSPRFVIIGAGMSGILSAVKLQEAGFDDLTIYEKASRLGGTWRENTYPGIACDVPSHLYSFSFAPNPDWTHRFSPGAEIQQYLENVAKRFDVERFIRANTEIRRCAWLDGRWEIETAAGEIDHADFIIAATGVLHHPNIPSIPGLETFAGSSFHSARWDHQVKLDGQRVGVIGTGSSAVQIVSALVDRVAEISLFQRTPQWIMPQENPPFSEAEKSDFRTHPQTMKTLREEVSKAFSDNFSNAVVDAESPQMKLIEELCAANLEQNVTDPELREQLRPDYRAACKRLVISEDFYQAIQKPNARLVVDAIEQIEPEGVRTRNGQLHELDVLVLATGFQVDRFMRPIQILGKDGIDLDQIWAERPSAYLAISVPDLPNLFMLNGPNGPVGNFSLIDVAELQFGYIMQLIQEVLEGRCREISASRAATELFESDRVEAAKSTVWTTGCRSWYLDDRGIPAVWPWTFDRFREEMSEPKLQNYDRN